jgi:hypothetical protein
MIKGRRGVVCALAVLIWLSLLVGVSLLRPPSARAALPISVSEPIQRANKALAKTETLIMSHKLRKAIDSLQTLRLNVRRANNAATDQIGLPPSDPEGDEPPGPPCVFAALKLDHRVGMRLVPLFDGLSREDVVESLLATLVRLHDRRDAMLDAVIALPPEGARGDYDDGMSDTLPMYPSETELITAALAQEELTTAAHEGLQDARERVQATEAKVNEVWGGGE